MENIKKQIRNLVYNSLDSTGKKNANLVSLTNQKTPEEIKHLALKELEIVESFIMFEEDDFNYWKDKKSRLCFIIYLQNKKIKRND